jgi:hypothetical protein
MRQRQMSASNQGLVNTSISDRFLDDLGLRVVHADPLERLLRGRTIRNRLCEIEIRPKDCIIHRITERQYKPPRRKGTELSRLSRKSVQRLKLTIRNTSRPLTHFISLTYPGHYIERDGEKVKRDIAAFRKRLRRKGISGVWWLEFQKRGAPHVHFAIDGEIGPDYQKACQWVSVAWWRIVGSGHVNHLKAGTRYEKFRRSDGAEVYIQKEACKMYQKTVPEKYQNVGRFWAFFGDIRGEVRRIYGTIKEMAGHTRLIRKIQSRKQQWKGGKVRDNGIAGWVAWGMSSVVCQI